MKPEENRMEMIKVKIEEKYSTSLGKIIKIKNTTLVQIGNQVLGDDNIIYVVKQVIMPTSPHDLGSVLLLVE